MIVTTLSPQPQAVDDILPHSQIDKYYTILVFRIRLKAKANPLALALALLIFLGPLVLAATKG
jgi:hypothetical protein